MKELMDECVKLEPEEMRTFLQQNILAFLSDTKNIKMLEKQIDILVNFRQRLSKI